MTNYCNLSAKPQDKYQENQVPGNPKPLPYKACPLLSPLTLISHASLHFQDQSCSSLLIFSFPAFWLALPELLLPLWRLPLPTTPPVYSEVSYAHHPVSAGYNHHQHGYNTQGYGNPGHVFTGYNNHYNGYQQHHGYNHYNGYDHYNNIVLKNNKLTERKLNREKNIWKQLWFFNLK